MNQICVWQDCMKIKLATVQTGKCKLRWGHICVSWKCFKLNEKNSFSELRLTSWSTDTRVKDEKVRRDGRGRISFWPRLYHAHRQTYTQTVCCQLQTKFNWSNWCKESCQKSLRIQSDTNFTCRDANTVPDNMIYECVSIRLPASCCR